MGINSREVLFCGVNSSVVIERKRYRWCIVPECTNTTITTPNKIFVDVPRKSDIRKKWFDLARRKWDGMSVTSPIYCCEDHFDLPNDMENYMQYHVMGTVGKVMIKPGCLPTKFQCQSDRKRSLPSTVTSRPAVIKRQRLALVQEALENSTFESDTKEVNTTLFSKSVKLEMGDSNYHSPFNFVEVKTEAPDEIFYEEYTDNFINVKTEIDEYDSNGEENVADSEDVIVKEEELWLEKVKRSKEENLCEIKCFEENEPSEIQEDVTNKSEYSCNVCGKSFEYHCDYDKHVQSSSCDKPLGENRIGWKCDLDKIKHDDERQHKCDVCDKTFMYKTSLNKHAKRHTGEKPIDLDKLFECELCGKRFGQKYHLSRHSFVHKDQLRFECGMCDKRFGSQDALDAHLKAHAGRTPFKCELCATTFNEKFSYQKHMLVHKDEKLFKCNLCDKRFQCRSYLNRHVLTHSGNGIGCDLCGKSFKRKWTLDRHLLMHTGEKPFKCSMCDLRFVCRSYLNRHVLTHSNYSFGCHLCSKKFERKWVLDRHLLVHSGEKPFKCSMCARSFNQKSSLVRHLLKHTDKKCSS